MFLPAKATICFVFQGLTGKFAAARAGRAHGSRWEARRGSTISLVVCYFCLHFFVAVVRFVILIIDIHMCATRAAAAAMRHFNDVRLRNTGAKHTSVGARFHYGRVFANLNMNSHAQQESKRVADGQTGRRAASKCHPFLFYCDV